MAIHSSILARIIPRTEESLAGHSPRGRRVRTEHRHAGN